MTADDVAPWVGAGMEREEWLGVLRATIKRWLDAEAALERWFANDSRTLESWATLSAEKDSAYEEHRNVWRGDPPACHAVAGRMKSSAQ